MEGINPIIQIKIFGFTAPLKHVNINIFKKTKKCYNHINVYFIGVHSFSKIPYNKMWKQSNEHVGTIELLLTYFKV